MIRKLFFIIFALLLIIACKSVESDRIKKDIVGINEQLYELEKNQITSDEFLKRLSKKVADNAVIKSKKKHNNNMQELYSSGYKLFLEEKYDKALDILKKIVSRFEKDNIVDNSLFWIAESFLKLKDLKSAIGYYQILYRYFPFSDKADYSLFKIGYIYYQQKKYSKAKLAFMKLLNEYPDSDFRRSALSYNKKIKKMRRKR